MTTLMCPERPDSITQWSPCTLSSALVSLHKHLVSWINPIYYTKWSPCDPSLLVRPTLTTFCETHIPCKVIPNALHPPRHATPHIMVRLGPDDQFTLLIRTQLMNLFLLYMVIDLSNIMNPISHCIRAFEIFDKAQCTLYKTKFTILQYQFLICL